VAVGSTVGTGRVGDSVSVGGGLVDVAGGAGTSVSVGAGSTGWVAVGSDAGAVGEGVPPMSGLTAEATLVVGRGVLALSAGLLQAIRKRVERTAKTRTVRFPLIIAALLHWKTMPLVQPTDESPHVFTLAGSNGGRSRVASPGHPGLPPRAFHTYRQPGSPSISV
jgi:hypothetical protein